MYAIESTTVIRHVVLYVYGTEWQRFAARQSSVVQRGAEDSTAPTTVGCHVATLFRHTLAHGRALLQSAAQI